jgi:predicted ribosome quality control (RQC) complex YloA/Tae2 family protein
MNFKECKVIADELDLILKEGVIQKIKESEAGDFYFSIYKSKESYNLLISPSNIYPRIYLTENDTPKSNLRNFGMYLRKHVAGKRIEKISAVENERIIEVYLSCIKIIAVLIPRSTNIYITDLNNKVEYSLYKTEDDIFCQPDGGASYQDVKDPPVDENMLYSHILDKKYADIIEEDDFRVLKKRSVKALSKEAARLNRKVLAIKNDMADVEKEKLYLKFGNLIKANFYNVKKGNEELYCTDYETLEDVVIKLDKKLSPEENMAFYFKKAKKAKSSKEYALKNLKMAQERLLDAQGFLEKIESLDDASLIKLEIDKLKKHRYLRKIAGNIKDNQTLKKAPKSDNTPYKYFETEDGKRIYVGRSDEENDKLTFSFGRGRDIWLHVADYPGSHILVPMENDTEDIDKKLLDDAALLALRYSKAKGKDVNVTYTKRKYVTKSKGMPKGMVNVSKFKTVFVKYNEERLRELSEMN